MKKAFLPLFLLLFCAAGWAQAAQSQNSGALAEALIAKSKAFPQAMKAKDLEGLKNLLADDFRIVASDGRLHEKGELLGAAQEGALQDFIFYDPSVVQLNDETALVTYNLIVNMPEGDDGLAPRYQKVSDLWVRQGNDWRLKFEQATPLRPID